MIFCSSQSPFCCSPTCPLLVVATLLSPWSVGTGWNSYPFFPSCWRADSARAPTSYLAGSGLGPRTADRPWAGEGTGGASLSCFPQLAVIRLQPLPI